MDLGRGDEVEPPEESIHSGTLWALEGTLNGGFLVLIPASAHT